MTASAPNDLARRMARRTGSIGFWKSDPVDKLRRKPKRHSGSREANNRDLDSGDFLQEEGLDFREGVTRITEVAGGFALEQGIGRQDRHGGALDGMKEGFDAPVELVIANDPGIVPEQVEELDHHPALIGERELGALVDVANIDQERVWIFLPPAPDLRDATRHPAEIGAAVVIDCRQDMAMQIGRVQEGNA